MNRRGAEEADGRGRTSFVPTVHARGGSANDTAASEAEGRHIYVSGLREGVAVRAKAKVLHARWGPATELGCVLDSQVPGRHVDMASSYFQTALWAAVRKKS